MAWCTQKPWLLIFFLIVLLSSLHLSRLCPGSSFIFDYYWFLYCFAIRAQKCDAGLNHQVPRTKQNQLYLILKTRNVLLGQHNR